MTRCGNPQYRLDFEWQSTKKIQQTDKLMSTCPEKIEFQKQTKAMGMTEEELREYRKED